ncbi:MAG TPA: light-harvesting antenna LH1, alpha subunit [Gemmatirosa sp.]|nr:light-harvesting antenna LH1, alpha subunit [Gemmatirosa sp.]
MHRIWMIFDPRRTLIALFAFLFTLALVIHAILLSTRRFNWLDANRAAGMGAAAVAPTAAIGANPAATAAAAQQAASPVPTTAPPALAGGAAAGTSAAGTSAAGMSAAGTSATAPAATVYFAVGAAAIDAEGAQAIRAAASGTGGTGRVAITGYTDATGNLSANQELAKNRATAVRDALVAAGGGADRIEMRPPASVEANAVGGARAARRVEVTRIP